MTTHPPSVSVVIPIYRSAASLPELTERLVEVLRSRNVPFEVILVNDGSPDNSEAVMQTLAENFPELVCISLMRNYGQHNALLCGIREARYPIVVTMDDDLQHPPEEIPRLLEPLIKGEADVVYGSPPKGEHGFVRNLCSRVVKIALSTVVGVHNALYSSAFRAFRTDLRDAFANYRSPVVSVDVLLSWGTTRFGHVFVDHQQRKHGSSNYSFRRLFSHALVMMTGFSKIPLRLAIYSGFLMVIFGVCVLAYVLYVRLKYATAVPGFAFLAVLVSLFSGTQLFTLGILGEYIGRMHFRMMDRPTYTVRKNDFLTADPDPAAR